METPLKSEVLKNLINIQSRSEELIRKKSASHPNYYQYTHYDGLIGETSVIISQYSSDIKLFNDLLKKLPNRPTTGQQLIEAHKTLITILNALREDINANFAFKLNDNSDSFIISREYLNSLNIASAVLIDTTRSNEELREENRKIETERLALQIEAQNLNNKVQTSLIQINAKQANINELEGFISNNNNNTQLLNNEIISLKAELAHYKEQAQKIEVARSSTDFHEQAEGNKKTAYKWMYAIIAGGALFIAFLWHMFSSDAELFSVATGIIEKSKGIDAALVKQLILVEIGKKIGSKVLIVSLLTYVITFLVKNYNAQMHNYIVNSHKANALRSTVDLIGTARGDDGNDKIVLQATQAIFTTQKSGYQGADSEPVSPNLITNVIDAVSGSKKS